jgi:cytochrome c
MKYLAAVALPLFTCLVSIDPAFANEQLMEKSGCISCHRVDQKLIGPAFKDVAARYKKHPEVIDTLLQKVREGGEGVWGDVPMAPNLEEKVSDENLRIILEWILSL